MAVDKRNRRGYEKKNGDFDGIIFIGSEESPSEEIMGNVPEDGSKYK